MKTVKYQFMNKIQNHTVYTKQELLDLFANTDHYYHDLAIQVINKPDAEKCLAEILEKLADQLEDREYLDIELNNILYAIEKKHDIVRTLDDLKQVWQNVLSS